MTWHDTTTHRYVEQIFRQSNWIGNPKLTFAFYSPSHCQLLLLDLSIYLKNCMFTIGNWSRIRISSLRALWQWISYSNRDSSYNFRRKGIFLFFFFTDLLNFSLRQAATKHKHATRSANFISRRQQPIGRMEKERPDLCSRATNRINHGLYIFES